MKKFITLIVCISISNLTFAANLNNNIFITIDKNEKIKITNTNKNQTVNQEQKFIEQLDIKISKNIIEYQNILKKLEEIITIIKNNKDNIINGKTMTQVIEENIGKPTKKLNIQDYNYYYDCLVYKQKIDSITILIPILDSLPKDIEERYGDYGEAIGAAIGGTAGSIATVCLAGTDLGASILGGLGAGGSIGAVIGKWLGKKIGRNNNAKDLFNVQLSNLKILTFDKPIKSDCILKKMPQFVVALCIISELIPELDAEIESIFIENLDLFNEIKQDIPAKFINLIKSKFTTKELTQLKTILESKFNKATILELRQKIKDINL